MWFIGICPPFPFKVKRLVNRKHGNTRAPPLWQSVISLLLSITLFLWHFNPEWLTGTGWLWHSWTLSEPHPVKTPVGAVLVPPTPSTETLGGLINFTFISLSPHQHIHSTFGVFHSAEPITNVTSAVCNVIWCTMPCFFSERSILSHQWVLTVFFFFFYQLSQTIALPSYP